MPNPLRDPEWPGATSQCLACGYSLRGLGSSCHCPECGFTVDDRTLLLQGVLNRGVSATPLRVGLWAIVFALGIGLLYFWMLILLFLGWVLVVVLFFVWLGLLLMLIFSSKRERAGRFTFVFTLGGFQPVVGVDDEQPEGEPTPWEQVRRVELIRVSPVWRTLIISGAGRKLLHAGVRCPDADAERVFQALEAYRVREVGDAC